MPLPAIPLANHRAFSAASVEALVSRVETQLGAVCVAMPTEGALDALANRYRLPRGELWFCSYGEPVSIRFGETDYVRVQFPHIGSGATHLGRHEIEVGHGQGCISSGPATLAFGAGYQQLVWRVERAALVRKLEAITGGVLSRQLEFAPQLDLRLPAARPLLGLVHDLVHCASGAHAHHEFVEGELEQALMVSLLTHATHNGGHLLDRHPGDAAPWQVRRVEDYIAAHLDVPFSIEAAVALTGCSARTLYRAFKKYRGYSPAEFSKQRRLHRARELLRAGSPFHSVTEVAGACGFADLSHFSRDYAALFGETPSQTKRLRV